MMRQPIRKGRDETVIQERFDDTQVDPATRENAPKPKGWVQKAKKLAVIGMAGVGAAAAIVGPVVAMSLAAAGMESNPEMASTAVQATAGCLVGGMTVGGLGLSLSTRI